MHQITEWLERDVEDDTSYGKMSNLKWLKFEQARLSKRGIKTAIETKKDDKGYVFYALFRIVEKK